MELFIEALLDAFIDSAKMLPLLFVIYVLIEVVEYRFGNKLGQGMGKAGKAGPAVGALAGSIPQCGISVMATALYSQRLLTIGTLMAVYLSTSDEAIPVILSQPDKAGVLVPLIAAKIIIGLVAGYLIDFVFHKRNKKVFSHIEAVASGKDLGDHDHSHVLDEEACCGHGHVPGASDKPFKWARFLLHPLIHTLKIFIFIFLVSLALNLIIEFVGIETMTAALSGHALLQPIGAALIGLIPNCAASVAITELFLEGAISFPAVVAGLCASGGLGIIVLFKEESSKKEAVGIVALLFAISVVVGLICGIFL